MREAIGGISGRMTDAVKLELRDIVKRYKSITALKGLSYTFTPGVYGILGPNGAGKSTLMNIITDNLRYDSGSVLFNGKEIKSLGKEYRSRIGYMPQQQEVYEELTLNRFLFYIASLKGMKREAAAEEIERILMLVRLNDVCGRRLGQFSGGMKQRALIAQALLGNPDILILDEPTAGLDPKERIRIRNLISEVARNKIVLISTHVVSDIEFISKEVLFLKKGEIVKCGNVVSLCSQLSGRVFEIVAEPTDIKDLEQTYKVSVLTGFGELIKVRIITDTKPAGGEAVEATLEDLYLDIFE